MTDPAGLAARLAEQRARTGFRQNPEWADGQAGTFAVIVGVSRYPYLTPYRRHRSGLDEGLYVSASTAFDFHRWLTAPVNGFAWPAAPWARTWLLLAPTDAELQHDPELAAARYDEPSFYNLTNALDDWFLSMSWLSEPAAQASCGIVFFSGHGVSYGAEGQLLLPMDWPDPLHANADNWAAQTQFLLKGTSVLPVRNLLFFIDACWNSGGTKVNDFKADGLPILPLPADSAMKTKNQRQAVIFAAAEGSQTMQPTDPAIGISVFGKALMASLRMPGGTPVDSTKHRDGLDPVGFAPLVQDVGSRVRSLLRTEVGIDDEEAPVSDGGNGISLAYATWRPAALRAVPEQPLPTPPLPEPVFTRHEVTSWGPHGEFLELHDLVHHESISWPLMRLRLFRLTGGHLLPDAPAIVSNVDRNDGSSLVRCDLHFDPAAEIEPLWMVLADHTQPETAWATTLPLGTAVTYTVTFRQVQDGHPPRVRFALAARNSGVLAEAVTAWTQLGERPDRRPGAGLDPRSLIEAVLVGSTVPATVLAAELLASTRLPVESGGPTTGQLQRFWLAHPSADSAVLYANRLIEEGGHDRAEIDAILDSLWQLGLPKLNAVAELLDDIALIRRHRGELLSIEPWLSAATRVRYRGGMLTSYAGSVGRLGPWLARPANWPVLSSYASDVYRPPPAGQPGLRQPDFPPLTPLGSAVYQALGVLADTAGTVLDLTDEVLAARADLTVESVQGGMAELRRFRQLTEYADTPTGGRSLRLVNPPPSPASPEWWSIPSPGSSGDV